MQVDNETRKYAKLYIDGIDRLWGISGSGVIVFTDLIMRMDERNNAFITTAQKRELIMQNAAKANKGSKTMTPKQAGTRYSQVIMELVGMGVIQKITSDMYKVDFGIAGY